jgi:ABC-type phosphonate transport system ATPase subunit
VSSFVQDRNALDCLRCVDKALADVPRDKIREQLLEVGFDKSRQTEIVGGLSGGWKMKLELARAMLYNADLLLLDEVCCMMIYSYQLTSIDCLLRLIQPTNHVCDFHVWLFGPVLIYRILVRQSIGDMVGRIPYCAYQCNVFDRQP